MRVFLLVLILCILYLTTVEIEKESIETNIETSINNIDLNYNIFNIQGGKRNVFVPIFDNGSNKYTDLLEYIKIFNIEGSVEENDIYYKVIDNKKGNYICVYKNMNSYKYVQNDKTSYTKVDEYEAIKLANNFLEQYNIIFNYDEIIVREQSEYYEINYISILDNMSNYSFSNIVTIDKKGNIKSFKYYNIKYKKLGGIEIIKEKDAYSRLLDEYKPIYETSINKCDLVYLYSSSVILPHYLFYGDNTRGEKVEVFISATK